MHQSTSSHRNPGLDTISEALQIFDNHPSLGKKETTDEFRKFIVDKIIEVDFHNDSQKFEYRKWRWNTPIAVALTGLITLSGNFLFDYLRQDQTTGDQITLRQLDASIKESESRSTKQRDVEIKQLEQILKQRSEDAASNRSAETEERQFQFKIVERELSQDKSESDRAKILLFLVKTGILKGLNEEELTKMATATLEKQGQNVEDVGVPSFGRLPTVEGPKTLTKEYKNKFENFFNSLNVKNIQSEQFLVRGASNETDSSSTGGLNSYPPENLWMNMVPTIKALDAFVERYGAQIEIRSAFRSTAYNRALGGSTKSRHLSFSSVDFVVVGKGMPADWANVLEEIREEGIFEGGIGVYLNFVHVDSRGTRANWGRSSPTVSSQ